MEGFWFGGLLVSSLLFADDGSLLALFSADLHLKLRLGLFVPRCKAARTSISTSMCEATVLSRGKNEMASLRRLLSLLISTRGGLA